jgi:hypothetical protein
VDAPFRSRRGRPRGPWAGAGPFVTRGSRPGHGIDTDHPLVIHLDATLVTAHSEKESAGPDVQAWLWVSSVVCVRRPRPRRHW